MIELAKENHTKMLNDVSVKYIITTLPDFKSESTFATSSVVVHF